MSISEEKKQHRHRSVCCKNEYDGPAKNERSGVLAGCPHHCDGDTTPGHVLSLETLRLVRDRLTERGILAINLIGSLKNESFMTASIIRTLRQVFATLLVNPNFDPAEDDGNGNITILAYNAALPPFDRRLVAPFPVHRFPTAELNRFLGRTYALPPNTRAVVLTDDYNPIDFYDVKLKEWFRKLILDGVDMDILL